MIMDNVHVLDRSTLSMSTQLFAKLKAEKLPEVFLERLNDRNVFVKIGFSSAKDNSIEVEHSIYAYLSEMVPLYSRTPNLMRYIGSFVCNDFVNYVSHLLRTEKNEDVKKLVRQIEQIKSTNPDLDISRAYILILERGRGMSLYDCLIREVLSRTDLIMILFQVFYTLRQLYIVKVKHNDLHLGNIWVDILDDPIELTYFISDDVYYKLRTRYIAKIFDFDKSVFTLPGRDSIHNQKIQSEFCLNLGVCELPDERRDIYQLVFKLYTTEPNDRGVISGNFRNTIARTIIPDPSLLHPDCCREPGIPCKIIKVNQREVCDPTYVIPPSSVLSFLQMCNESLIFEWMRYSLPYDGYPLKDKPFPSVPKRPGVMYKLPIGPSIFTRPLYFSLDCSLTPFEMGVQLQEIIEEERSRLKPELPIPEYQGESETEEIFSD